MDIWIFWKLVHYAKRMMLPLGRRKPIVCTITTHSDLHGTIAKRLVVSVFGAPLTTQLYYGCRRNRASHRYHLVNTNDCESVMRKGNESGSRAQGALNHQSDNSITERRFTTRKGKSESGEMRERSNDWRASLNVQHARAHYSLHKENFDSSNTLEETGGQPTSLPARGSTT